MEKLVEMKREREYRIEEKVGGKESTELETNQKEHSSMNPISSPMNPVSSPMSPISSPVSPVSPPVSHVSSSVSSVSSPVSPQSSTGDQVQATLPSSPPPKRSGYLHYGMVEMYFAKVPNTTNLHAQNECLLMQSSIVSS